MPFKSKLPAVLASAILSAISSEVLAAPEDTIAAPDAPPDAQIERETIVVYGRSLEQIGTARSGSEGTVGYADFQTKPLSRVGELVENVPGVIATQHSGTGKANQYFLRGFNLDHGTDFAAFFDGAPINLRSHGHGQGYLDLNFVIPELVERIDYRKGPYFADVGDFSAAGTVSFRTRRTLDSAIADFTAGSFGYLRSLLAGSTPIGGGDLLMALEGTRSNGPWVLDERLRKVNGVIKYAAGSTERGFSIGLSGYRATWQATDQVPERAIADGRIDRFGFVDPDLGGETTRLAATLNGQIGRTRINGFALHYDFALTSNFTYLLDNPVDGDEFRQQDRRQVYGMSAVHVLDAISPGVPIDVTVGGDMRYDRIGNGLYRSIGGRAVSTVREDRIGEFSAAAFLEAQIRTSDRLRVIVGLRGDYFDNSVASDLAVNSGNSSDFILGPKLGLAWQPMGGVELYGNYGESYHSNDVRGTTISIDPVSGDPADPVPVLVRARGAEIGGRIEGGAFTASAAVFMLDLASELVFVGDGGATEPNEGSRRIGGEASMFWQPMPWLTLDGSASVPARDTAGQVATRRGSPVRSRIPSPLGRPPSSAAACQAPCGCGTLAPPR